MPNSDVEQLHTPRVYIFTIAAIFELSALLLIAVSLIWKIMFWLKHGFWLSMTVRDHLMNNGFKVPRLTWAGVQKILDLLVLDRSAEGFGLGLFAVSSLLILIVGVPKLK